MQSFTLEDLAQPQSIIVKLHNCNLDAKERAMILRVLLDAGELLAWRDGLTITVKPSYCSLDPVLPQGEFEWK